MSAHLDRQRSFDDLIRDVQACNKCPRMCDSARVLNRGAGPLTAPIMFVGEAPGRLGADASEIPFHGDKSGHNFESLLATAGLDRYRTFVTNAALCNPRDEHGNNATPSPSELKNCSEHLKRQIDLVNPEVIVTLGAKALEAMNNIDPHGLKLASSVRKAVWWYGRQLVPLYHPGQRAMIHRSFATQLSDYYFVAELLRRRRGRPMTQKNLMKFETRHVVSQIFALLPRLSYFALHKMFYLIEYHSVKERGERFTGAYSFGSSLRWNW